MFILDGISTQLRFSRSTRVAYSRIGRTEPQAPALLDQFDPDPDAEPSLCGLTVLSNDSAPAVVEPEQVCSKCRDNPSWIE